MLIWFVRISSIGTGASDKGKVYVAGKLGIGDTTPSYPLDVAGDINVKKGACINTISRWISYVNADVYLVAIVKGISYFNTYIKF